jgi:thioredoxin 2
MFRCHSCGALNNVAGGHAGSPVCGRCKRTLDVSGAAQDVDGKSLGRVVDNATVPVLVDFWAPWCGPCRTASPILEEFAREKAGDLIALKVNADADPAAADTYGIQSIPTFMVFLNGRLVGRQSGVLPKDALSTWVASVTRSGPNGRSGRGAAA